MARIRTVKPEFWSHPVMGQIEDAAKCLALALLNFSDDEGYFSADVRLVRSFARPFDEDSTTVRRCLDQLVFSGWIQVKEHPSHGPIGFVVNFCEHQRIDRPKPSDLKAYFIDDDSTIDRRLIVAGKEGNREQGKEKNNPLPPTGSGEGVKQVRKPIWTKAHPEEVIKATQEIKAIWPRPEDDAFQPDGKTLVPGVSPSELASRLAEIKALGAELDICVKVAARVVSEWKAGKWIKAPQHFFGKAKDSPFRAYYQAYVTNEAVRLAS